MVRCSLYWNPTKNPYKHYAGAQLPNKIVFVSQVHHSSSTRVRPPMTLVSNWNESYRHRSREPMAKSNTKWNLSLTNRGNSTKSSSWCWRSFSWSTCYRCPNHFCHSNNKPVGISVTLAADQSCCKCSYRRASTSQARNWPSKWLSRTTAASMWIKWNSPCTKLSATTARCQTACANWTYRKYWKRKRAALPRRLNSGISTKSIFRPRHQVKTTRSAYWFTSNMNYASRPKWAASIRIWCYHYRLPLAMFRLPVV